MLTIKLCGGLGNQLFQLALGTQFEFLGRTVQYDVSGFEGDRARRYMLGDLGFALPLIYENLPVTFQEKCLKFDPEVLKLTSGVLNGYWQSEKYFADVSGYIRGQFLSKLYLSEKTKEIAKQIAALGTSSCFIHIRRSDNCDQFHKYGPYDGMTELTSPYYARAIEEVCAHVGEGHPCWFIFSDDFQYLRKSPEVTQTFNRRGDIPHFVDCNPPSFIEDSGHELFKKPDGREVEDLYLMSLCHNAIIANSTFSWWGAYLYRFRGDAIWGERPDRVICAPDPWYATPDFGETEIIPDRWTKISRSSASSDSEKSAIPSSQS